MTARGKKLLCYKELFISIKDKPRTEGKKKKQFTKTELQMTDPQAKIEICK